MTPWAPAGAGAESHMNGVGAAKIARPPGVSAVMSPARPAASRTPCVRVASTRCTSAGFAAAAASFTTSTSLNPPWESAVTRRSTPGSMSW